MKKICIDIETMPNLEMVKFLPQVEPDSRLKDPEKIAENIKKKETEQIEKMALNPLYGQIATIGYYSEDIQKVEFNLKKGDEAKMIKECLEICEEHDVYFTWNGKGFDFEFIVKRGIINGVCSLMDLKKYTDKYKSTNHIDLMVEWCGHGKYAKLDEVSYILLGEKKEEYDVTKIIEDIKTPTGREMLRRYNLRDVELLHKLAEKMGY